MMDRYPLHALRSLLAPSTVTRGTITAISGQRATLATPSGMATAIIGAESLRVGSAVTVRSGVAYPSARAGARYVL